MKDGVQFQSSLSRVSRTWRPAGCLGEEGKGDADDTWHVLVRVIGEGEWLCHSPKGTTRRADLD